MNLLRTSRLELMSMFHKDPLFSIIFLMKRFLLPSFPFRFMFVDVDFVSGLHVTEKSTIKQASLFLSLERN